MYRLRTKLLFALLAVAALGIGFSLGYSGLEPKSPAAPGCPFSGAGEDPQSDGPEHEDAVRVCPYSGATMDPGDVATPGLQPDASKERGECPYRGGERDASATDVERPAVARDSRNLV